MKLTLPVILTFFFFSAIVKADDFPYGSFTQQELKMTNYDKDISAHAVVLNEYGNARLTIVSSDEIRLLYQYHVKIKIFDENGFKHGTVEIPVYNMIKLKKRLAT